MEIEFKNVNYSNLKDINFKIIPNSITGIIGDNSKSEVANILAGINLIDNGEVIIGENIINNEEFNPEIFFNIGVLFDNLL